MLYTRSMFRFSKKRFFITLGISVLIWVITVVIQAFLEAPKYVALFMQSQCSATGYPFSFCSSRTPEFVIYFFNIFFWFWIVHLSWGFFKRPNR